MRPGLSHLRLVVPGFVALVFWAMGVASLIDALAGTHLASVDRPRGSAAAWGVVGVLVAFALTRWCLLHARRPVRPRR